MKKIIITLSLLLLVLALAQADPPASQTAPASSSKPAVPTAFEVKCRKAEDRVTVTTEDNKVVFVVISPSGIGSATVERKGDAWPKELVLRLYLQGLEKLTISCGETEIVVSTADRPKGLPGKAGYFEVVVPKAVLDEKLKTMKVEWVDFLR